MPVDLLHPGISLADMDCATGMDTLKGGVQSPGKVLTIPQPMRAVPADPEKDDRDWHLGRPADMDEYTDHPVPARSPCDN